MTKPLCLREEFDDIIADYPLNSNIERPDGLHVLFDKTCEECKSFGIQIIGNVEAGKIVGITTPSSGSCGKDQLLRIREN